MIEPQNDNAIDFSVLQNLTGGDTALESELLVIFKESAMECVDGLRLAIATGDDTGWKQHAHAFKGICLNLGANSLGALCRMAQEDFRANAEDKSNLLQAIEGELVRVTAAIAHYG